MNIKKPILLVALLFSLRFLQGQATLPNVVPPSPDVSSLTKYYDYPVSNCTGIPDITIPIYEIKSGQLNLPISISYHSSGRQVYDITGAVGLGWTLNAGGLISRTVYGDADDNDKYIKYPLPWRKVENIVMPTDFRFVAGIDNRQFDNIPQYDTEYDIFTYNINGLSGNFILKDVNNQKIPVLIPKKPYKVYWYQKSTTWGNYAEYFDIIDNNGITYRFGKSIQDNIEYRETSSPGTTGWMLTEIISANQEDKIQLKYTSFTCVRRTFSTTYKKVSECIGDPCPSPSVTSAENTSEESYTTQRISEIIFKQGKIIFNLEQQTGYGNDRNLLVKSIEVKDLNNITLKKIDLGQSVLNTMSDGIMPVYKLDNIIFRDKNLVAIENYTFEYYAAPSPMNVRYSDLWGYYNASGKSDMCPFVPVEAPNVIINNPNANRNSYEDAAKSGVLKKITYPTGGYTEFSYEINKYYESALKSCGGLRIYQIKTVDENNRILLRTFRYGVDECGYGYQPLVPTSLHTSFSTHHWFVNGNTGVLLNSYVETQYNSEILPIFSFVAKEPVIYTNITEYLGDLNNNIGKIIYTYDRGDLTSTPTMQILGAGGVNFRFWKRSDLLGKTTYAKTTDPGNPYKMVSGLVNTYTETEYPNEIINGLRIRRLYVILPEWVTGTDYYMTEEYHSSSIHGGLPIYAYADYTFSVGKKELTRTEETVAMNNGNIITVTTYTYDSNHLLKTKSFLDSKGDTRKEEYFHPPDSTGDPYGAMVVRNIINPVIKTNEFVNTTLTQSTKNNYAFFQGTSIIAPSNIQYKSGTNSYMTRLRFYDYDTKANLKYASKENDIKINYIYSYSNALPIAKIENAENSTVLAVLGGSTAVSNFSIKVNPTDAEIRTFLAPLYSDSRLSNASVTTYTYIPLIGMTSQTDPNGITNYYEYDDFGRLKLIKDNDGYILKTYEYHYKQ